MHTRDISEPLAALFSELTAGVHASTGGFVLNTGDEGMLRSLDRLSASDASHGLDGGATIAAHAQHVRYGLSLMNTWATKGGNPFADAKWDEAWKVSAVDEGTWAEIRHGLSEEVRAWRGNLLRPRDASGVELLGMIASVAHLAYHLGAIRQIAAKARGPREGAFA